ncbi:MAG: histidine kinase dimerization/phospho-acceptor domain-containing protein, partial [Pseudomonadota bacterium]
MTTPEDAIWVSLPVPAVIVGEDDTIARLNPAAEAFLLSSAKTIIGQPIWDRLAVDAPLEQAMERARDTGAPLFVNDVDIGTGDRAPMQCNLQIAPMSGAPGSMLILISPRELAGRITQSKSVKAAAKSAIGMAEMLAHEIKNPLAGITGAAQLLSMNLSGEDQDLTDLIVEETRRILKLLEQVEQFGNLSPPDRRPINVHDLLERARKTASVGFASGMTIEEAYDPSLPPTFVDQDQMLQVFQNLLKNAAEASGEGGGTIRLRTFYETSLRVRKKGGTASLPL